MLKAILIRKLLSLTKSSTAGVAGVILVTGGWLIAHPELVNQVSPKWGGVIVAAAGLAVAVARARSL